MQICYYQYDDKTTPDLEPQANAEVRPKRDGIPLHRRAEVFNKPADGKPGVATRVQGWGRLEVRPT